MARRDKLFSRRKRLIRDFDFGRRTATVFDDMLQRSVPFYAEVQRMISELASEFAVDGTHIYDLGCSTGTTLLALDPVVPTGVRFIGVDSSTEMLQRAREKLSRNHLRHEYELVRADLNNCVQMTNASAAIMILTLQFIRPLNRQRLLSDIARGLNDQGCLIMFEKVLSKDSLLNRLFIKFYYAFKEQNGYSRLEIAQKREALENVLIPYRIEENMELLLSSGFSQCDVFFKWYNFCGFVAVK
ncbi:MAG: carboxy-S-adenosyl-L-methionine synthase CmoA [Candidatus Omnitrophica bacterium]|nr:carboxy-S-adenosyl-L-methionine synthase CmoA [Candidatus Omnitrophota bacterium]